MAILLFVDLIRVCDQCNLLVASPYNHLPCESLFWRTIFWSFHYTNVGLNPAAIHVLFLCFAICNLMLRREKL